MANRSRKMNREKRLMTDVGEAFKALDDGNIEKAQKFLGDNRNCFDELVKMGLLPKEAKIELKKLTQKMNDARPMQEYLFEEMSKAIRFKQVNRLFNLVNPLLTIKERKQGNDKIEEMLNWLLKVMLKHNILTKQEEEPK